MGKLLTPAETAELLGLSVSTLGRWRKHKRGPSWVVIGNQIRYDPTVLQRFVSDRTRVTSLINDLKCK